MAKGNLTTTKMHWEAPPAGWKKVNVEGAFTEFTGEASVGIIAQDC